MIHKAVIKRLGSNSLNFLIDVYLLESGFFSNNSCDVSNFMKFNSAPEAREHLESIALPGYIYIIENIFIKE